MDELPTDIFEKVNEVILSFKHQPRPKGVKKLEGRENGWRVEVRRKYRILYTIDDQNKVVTIFKIKHRKEVYRRL